LVVLARSHCHPMIGHRNLHGGFTTALRQSVLNIYRSVTCALVFNLLWLTGSLACMNCSEKELVVQHACRKFTNCNLSGWALALQRTGHHHYSSVHFVFAMHGSGLSSSDLDNCGQSAQKLLKPTILYLAVDITAGTATAQGARHTPHAPW